MNETPVTPTPPGSDFVGRDREMGTLLVALEQARAGRGSLFLVGGEPGIGKSRLADELALRGRGYGLRVLWGKCWEGAGAPAYWPWIQALRGHLRELDAGAAREQLGAAASDLAQMLPEIRSLLPELPPAPADSDSARFQLFDSTAGFLRRMGRDRETLVVLDDLHAADAPSILLLRFLASQLGDMRLVLLGTYRDVAIGAGHPLGQALIELAREPVTSALVLKGLPEEAVSRLIASTAGVPAPPARLARHMWRETGGNPLFLAEAVRLLQSESRLDEATAADSLRLAVPASVRDVITRRVAQISERAQEALRVGAALGPEFSLEALRRVSGYPSDDALDLLDEAIDAGLVAVVTGALARYRFSHDLIRESVYQALPSGERVRLHRRIATSLEELYAPVIENHMAELAHQYMEAARGGQDPEAASAATKAEHYAVRAGELAISSLAYEEGARLYRMALAMLDLRAASDDLARTELLLRIGDAEARAGELESANASFRAAAELARRSGNSAHLARAALGLGGRLPWARPGSNADLLPLLQEALVLLGGADDQLRVRLLARLASAWRSSPDKRQQSDTLSREAIALARELEDPAALSYALAARYWATWWPENPDERRALTAEMISVSEELRDPERIVDARLMLWLSHSEMGRMEEARRELEQIRRVAHELRQPAQLWLGVAPRALMALMSGQYDLAADLLAEEFAPGPPTTPARDNVSIARFHRYLLCREQGRPQEAEHDLRLAVEEFPWYPLHGAALVLLLLDMDRLEEARSRFEALARDDFAAFYRDNEWLLELSLVAEACWRLAAREPAAVLYDQLADFSGRHAIGHAEGSVGSVDRYLGLLAMLLGRLEDAERHLIAAIEHNQQMGARPWAAHCQADLAELLSRRAAPSDQQHAAELAAAARTTATELGMPALLARLPAAEVTHPQAVDTVQPAIFRKEGEYWMIAYGGAGFRLRDAKGLNHLGRLLAQPGRELLALDLIATDAGSQGRSPRPSAAAGLRAGGDGDAGPRLDEQAKAEYRRRLHELQEELDEAEAWNDPERAERARQEMDFLSRELAGAVGLAGRDRVSGSASERARLSVTRAIRLAMGRIAEHDADLGKHLELTIHTGTYCAYRPDPRATVEWQL